MFSLIMKVMRDKKMLPRISDTERQALEAGTVWIDGQLFSGNPDFRSMLEQPYDALSDEERAFLEGPAEELCLMTDAHEVVTTNRVPEPVIDYIKKQGFMGLLIPKEYGGKGFSTLAISTIMSKVNAYCPPMGTFVVIPNSLGAAELLLHYGTEEQRQAYLPKLASGEYVPCFGLTELTAGSDAASIRAEGVVFKGRDGKPQIRLNFEKRYITLAPVANLISLAFQIHDPENLLGKGEYPGITVAMLHKGTKGLKTGDHHDPIGAGFYNGPIIGKDVEVSVDQIIGGAEYAGQGWRMLMEQLAGGRAVSLPAGAIGGMKGVAAATGAYSMIRRQFDIPIGMMEGVQEKVARIAAFTYLFEGARVYSCSAIDAGEKPPVISALMKSSSTEYAQKAAIDGMDVFSGAGVMQGPNNIPGGSYTSAPVSITVEGANIMTRTLMIFGQGATRCHPYALNLVRAVEDNNVSSFRRNLVGWLWHTASNWGRLKLRSLTRGRSAGSPVSNETATYYRRLGWAATRFALLSDLAMYFIGGKLKARGNLSGRFADALTWQVLAISTLRRYEAEGRQKEDLPLVRFSCEYALQQIQEAFEGIHANFDAPLVGWWLRGPASLFLRVNPLSRGPSDRLVPKTAGAIQRMNEQFRRLTSDIAPAPEDRPGMGRLMKAFRLYTETLEPVGRIIRAQKQRKLQRGLPHEVAGQACRAGIITEGEAQLLADAQTAAMEAIKVDVFRPEEYFRDTASRSGSSRKKASSSRSSTGKSTARKSAAKKSTAKKTAAKRSAAKSGTTKRDTAKQTDAGENREPTAASAPERDTATESSATGDEPRSGTPTEASDQERREQRPAPTTVEGE